MPTKSSRTPKTGVRIKRLPKEGDEITLRAKVTALGRNGHNTADTITVRIPGFAYPVTLLADYLNGADDE
jgi:hypothetical protein